jgi:hypothetical protein
MANGAEIRTAVIPRESGGTQYAAALRKVRGALEYWGARFRGR